VAEGIIRDGVAQVADFQTEREKRQGEQGPLLRKWDFLQHLLKDPRISQSAKCVAVVILDQYYPTGPVAISFPKIGEAVCLKRRAAIEAVQQLLAAGWFTCQSGGPANPATGSPAKANTYAPVYGKVVHETALVHETAPSDGEGWCTKPHGGSARNCTGVVHETAPLPGSTGKNRKKERLSVADATPAAGPTLDFPLVGEEEGGPLPVDPSEAEAAEAPKTETLPAVIDSRLADLAADMVAIWNAETAGALPVVAKLTDKRRKAALARLKGDFAGDMEAWRSFIRRVLASDFLTGGGERGWKADFEWCVGEANALKVIEGKYDDRPQGLGGQARSGGKTDLSRLTMSFGLDGAIPPRPRKGMEPG
jgi:hypothetical protein